MNQPTLLVVDDETDNLDALERIFRKRYHFLRANSGAEALQLLKNNPRVDVIISDQRMPQMTGVEFLEKTLSTHSKTVRILLTGYTEIDSIIAAVNQGHIFRYITKPWDSTDLSNSVEQAMDYYARGEQLELKNKELEKAFKELKILDETKNKFMILINHELKTPLTVISSFLELLLESHPTEDQKTYLDRIKKSTERLKEIIDDTLILTQHTAGIIKINLQAGSINEILRNALVSFQNEVSKKNLLTQLNLSTDPLESISFDPPLLQKVIKHLIGNAIRFAPNNSEIKLETHLQVNGQLITIENEGPKIPEYVIERLQTPFKLQSEIMNHSKGLGLGLSVVDAVLQRHNSQLIIENIKGSENPKFNSRVRVSFLISK